MHIQTPGNCMVPKTFSGDTIREVSWCNIALDVGHNCFPDLYPHHDVGNHTGKRLLPKPPPWRAKGLRHGPRCRRIGMKRTHTMREADRLSTRRSRKSRERCARPSAAEVSAAASAIESSTRKQTRLPRKRARTGSARSLSQHRHGYDELARGRCGERMPMGRGRRANRRMSAMRPSDMFGSMLGRAPCGDEDQGTCKMWQSCQPPPGLLVALPRLALHRRAEESCSEKKGCARTRMT